MSSIDASPDHLPATVMADREGLWSASGSTRRRLFGLLDRVQTGHAIVEVLRTSGARERRA
jgi:hypothetical protein